MRGRMVEMFRRRLLSAVSVGVVGSNPAVTVFMCGLLLPPWIIPAAASGITLLGF